MDGVFNYTALTDDDLVILKRWIKDNQQITRNRRTSFTDGPGAGKVSDIWLAKAPSGGIPAITGAVLGNAVCQIYQVIVKTDMTSLDRKIQALINPDSTPINEEVYNLYSSSVAPNAIVQIFRNSFGDWVCENPSGDPGLTPGGGAAPCADCQCANCIACLQVDNCEICPAGAPGTWEFYLSGWATYSGFPTGLVKVPYIGGCSWETDPFEVTGPAAVGLAPCATTAVATSTSSTTSPPELTGGYSWRLIAGSTSTLQLVWISGDDPLGIALGFSVLFECDSLNCECENKFTALNLHQHPNPLSAACSMCVSPAPLLSGSTTPAPTTTTTTAAPTTTSTSSTTTTTGTGTTTTSVPTTSTTTTTTNTTTTAACGNCTWYSIPAGDLFVWANTTFCNSGCVCSEPFDSPTASGQTAFTSCSTATTGPPPTTTTTTGPPCGICRYSAFVGLGGSLQWSFTFSSCFLGCNCPGYPSLPPTSDTDSATLNCIS